MPHTLLSAEKSMVYTTGQVTSSEVDTLVGFQKKREILYCIKRDVIRRVIYAVVPDLEVKGSLER